MSPRPGDVIGQTAGYTAQSQSAPSAIPAVDLASIPAAIVSRGRTAVSNVGSSVYHQFFSQNTYQCPCGHGQWDPDRVPLQAT
eukprot:154327-Amphidinium_carterae.3